MHQSSNHSKFQRMRRRLDLFRQKKEEQSVSHPLRACLPFLCATGVLMTTVVTAASCTLCYRVDAQGQSLAFFHDVATYDAAVSQAETRASKILETQYSLNQDLSVRATLAPKDQIESLSGVTGSLMESIPELEHVYTLSVDGTMVGAAQDPSVITQALNLVKERYTTPETRSLHIDSQVDIRYQYLPRRHGRIHCGGNGRRAAGPVPPHLLLYHPAGGYHGVHHSPLFHDRGAVPGTQPRPHPGAGGPHGLQSLG